MFFIFFIRSMCRFLVKEMFFLFVTTYHICWSGLRLISTTTAENVLSCPKQNVFDWITSKEINKLSLTHTHTHTAVTTKQVLLLNPSVKINCSLVGHCSHRYKWLHRNRERNTLLTQALEGQKLRARSHFWQHSPPCLTHLQIFDDSQPWWTSSCF